MNILHIFLFISLLAENKHQISIISISWLDHLCCDVIVVDLHKG